MSDRPSFNFDGLALYRTIIAGTIAIAGYLAMDKLSRIEQAADRVSARLDHFAVEINKNQTRNQLQDLQIDVLRRNQQEGRP